jgi:hypothetical protein
MNPVVSERRAAVIVAALVTAVASHAAAQDEVVRIDYRAPAGCPTEAQFLDSVSRRAARSRLAQPGEIARTFVVTVSANDEGSSARLEIKDSDRPIREVSATNCAEAAHAIALVTALAMDARAPPGDDEIQAAAPAPAAPPARTFDDAARPTPAAHPPPIDRSRVESPTRDRAPALESGPTLEAAGPRWEVGGQFVWHSPLAPSGAPGGALFAGRVAPNEGFSARGTLLYVQSGLIEAEQGAARVSLMAARFDGCPPAVGAESFKLRACLGFEGGRLRGQGRPGGAITETGITNDLWLATGVLARLDGIVGNLILLEVEGGPWFPLTRTEFKFRDPDIAIYGIPAVGAVFGAGAGFIFQ